jgi:hypothetical protein
MCFVGGLFEIADPLRATRQPLAQEALRALAALGRLCCFMVREASFCYCYQRRALPLLPGTAQR